MPAASHRDSRRPNTVRITNPAAATPANTSGMTKVAKNGRVEPAARPAVRAR